ncbi:MAG: LegC family aminotransferase [Bacteroidales bacterium]|jgi:aminotransferase in exopolysaccharide biosynthesis|nr:LegC family aminotransferase [Bacteroidales bacterium]
METILSFIRSTFHSPQDFIPLHDPRFVGNEEKYLNECIDSNFVSSVGEFVGRFERMCADYTGAKYAVAAMNGTSALHVALLMAGVTSKDEVITQPLTFIATANAISYTGAAPVFVDVDRDTMGLSPASMEEFLFANAEMRDDGFCYNKVTGKRIAACVPMHTFGHPVKLDELVRLCKKYNIVLVEDAAESIGSTYKGKHTGTFGKLGILSFNGNKVITTGGGGMILTDDEEIAKYAKHITTQAKVPHRWEFAHDEIAYNYRLTNISAALGCAQMESLPQFIEAKRKLAEAYKAFFADTDYIFFAEPKDCQSNYWLNVILAKNREQRDKLLTYTNDNGVMTRPIWRLMNELNMFKHCQCGNLDHAKWFEERVVNIPSSVIIPNYRKNK